MTGHGVSAKHTLILGVILLNASRSFFIPSRNLQSEHRRTIDEGLEPESTPPTLALAVREKRLSKMEKEKNVLAEKRWGNFIAFDDPEVFLSTFQC